jgi:hypothetical protein
MSMRSGADLKPLISHRLIELASRGTHPVGPVPWDQHSGDFAPDPTTPSNRKSAWNSPLIAPL